MSRRARKLAAPPADAPATPIIDHDDRPRSYDDNTPVEDFAQAAGREGPQFTASRKASGWTPERQRAYLDYLAGGLTVGDAATLVGLSATSAYAFRSRAAGAAFAVGWQAALLLQRNRLVDELTSRAFRGQTETVTRDDGTQIERHRYDNRLALALLTRLDKIASADLPDRTGDARAARLAAQDWDRYLDLIGGDASAAQAGLFLALRVTEGEASGIEPITALARADLYRRTHVSHVAEIDMRDLDPAHRADWTAEQWSRAEAAGLVALAPVPEPEPEPEESPLARGNSQPSQHSPANPDADERETDPVWWCNYADAWRTRFPPPDDFLGDEEGDYGEDGYERTLSEEELAAWDAPLRREADRRRPGDEAQRDAFFARLLAGEDAATADDPPADGPAPRPPLVLSSH